MSAALPDLRCAVQMRGAGADPVGTAGSHPGFLLVPWPLPWPHDLSEVEELAPVRDVLAGTGVRVQGVVPAQGTPRLALYRRPGGAFTRYTCDTAVVAEATGASRALAGRLLARAAESLLGSAPVRATVPSQPAREVLLCTHGRRDRCCGSLGTELWAELRDEALGVRTDLHRTSHTGGHRYAPTMIVLPEGTVWGFVDAETARHILHHDVPFAQVAGSYRGCAGLPSPPAQALERAVLVEEGWGVLDGPRTATDLGDGRWALDAYNRSGIPSRWEAVVRSGRAVTMYPCGAPPAPDTEARAELVVEDLAQVA